MEKEFGNKQEIATQLLHELEVHPVPKQGDLHSHRTFAKALCQVYRYLEMYMPDELYRAPKTLGMLTSKLHLNDRNKYLKDYESKLARATTPEERAQLENYQIKCFKDWMVETTDFLERSQRMAAYKPIGSQTSKPDQAMAGMGGGGGKSPTKFDFKGKRKDKKPYPHPQTLNFGAQSQDASSYQSKGQQGPKGGGKQKGGKGQQDWQGGKGGKQQSRNRQNNSAGGQNKGNYKPNEGRSGTSTSWNKTAGGPAAKQTRGIDDPSKAQFYPKNQAKQKTGRCQHCFSITHATAQCQLSDAIAKSIMDINVCSRICLNCNRSGHTEGDCNKAPACTICQGLHTTTLHKACIDIRNAKKANKQTKKDAKA